MAAWRLWPVDITRCCTSSQVMFFLACKPAIYFLLVFWGLFFCLWLWLQYVICSSVFGSADWLDTTIERNNRKQPKKPPKHCVSGRLLGSEKLIRARIHPAAVDSLIINKKNTHTKKTGVSPMRWCFGSVLLFFFIFSPLPDRLSSFCHCGTGESFSHLSISVRPLQAFYVLCILESVLVFNQFFLVTESII